MHTATWCRLTPGGSVTQLLSFAYLAIFILSCIILLTGKTETTEDEKASDPKSDPGTLDGEFDLPLIFVGGVPRSGTTLMRTMLDAHPDIRCGPETHVIPGLLIERTKWLDDAELINILEEAGVQPEALNIAIGRFIIEIIKNHGSCASYYCNKDPLVLTDIRYVHGLFPRAKFIYMVRDGRACAYSIVSREVAIQYVDMKNYTSVLQFWNENSELIHSQCEEVGQDFCLPVHYEQLVLQPVKTTKQIFSFLNIPWSKDVLHHDRFVEATGLPSLEFSSDQVRRPLYLDALTSWFGHIPPDVERNMDKIAPMLFRLGYDPKDTRPTYGDPDDFVLGKLKI